MEIITNLEDAKELAIGEHFIFGEYEEQSIEWIKIAENLAISDKVLDCIVFDTKSEITYDESNLRKWCNNTLGKSLGVSEDTVYELSYEEMRKYFPSAESRQAKPTEWAIIHGVYVDEEGYSSYWTSSPMSCWYNYARMVLSSGSFYASHTNYSRLGVRPALKLD